MVKKTFGMLIITLGLLMFLANIDVFAFRDVINYFWPLALIAIGIAGMLEKKNFDILYTIFIVFGINKLFLNVGIIDVNLFRTLFWPTILIFVGSTLLFNNRVRPKIGKTEKYYTAVFGGFEEKSDSKDFKQCDVTAIFGGGKIDFSEITLKDDKAYINVTTVFGGVELILPKEYRVNVNGFPIFGECKNTTVSNEKAKKEIIVNYTVLFGDVEIKN